MHLEILPPEPAEGHPDQLVADLEQGLREVLRLVEEAVEDWAEDAAPGPSETIALLGRPAPGRRAAPRRQLGRASCWTGSIDNHFTFLGYREYALLPADDRPACRRGTSRCPPPGSASCAPTTTLPAPSTPCRPRERPQT